jgi:hypothetical protein
VQSNIENWDNQASIGEHNDKDQVPVIQFQTACDEDEEKVSLFKYLEYKSITSRRKIDKNIEKFLQLASKSKGFYDENEVKLLINLLFDINILYFIRTVSTTTKSYTIKSS